MNLDTCAMTATRSVEHLWRARSNRGGVGADHNSLIVFQIHDNRRSAPAIGNLLPHVYANKSLFVVLTAQCFVATSLKCILYLDDRSLRQTVASVYFGCHAIIRLKGIQTRRSVLTRNVAFRNTSNRRQIGHNFHMGRHAN